SRPGSTTSAPTRWTRCACARTRTSSSCTTTCEERAEPARGTRPGSAHPPTHLALRHFCDTEAFLLCLRVTKVPQCVRVLLVRRTSNGQWCRTAAWFPARSVGVGG